MSEEDKAYSLPWMKRWRKDVFERMRSFVKSEKETPAQKGKRTRLANLLKEVEKLSKEVRNACPHILENQRYEEHGRQNTLGSWAAGMDYWLRCEGCGNTLDRWSD